MDTQLEETTACKAVQDCFVQLLFGVVQPNPHTPNAGILETDKPSTADAPNTSFQDLEVSQLSAGLGKPPWRGCRLRSCETAGCHQLLPALTSPVGPAMRNRALQCRIVRAHFAALSTPV